MRNQKYSQAKMEGIGLKWYWFNIYFRLFASILFNLIAIVNVCKYSAIGVNSIIGIFQNIILVVWTAFVWKWLLRFEYKGVINYFLSNYGVALLEVLVTAIWAIILLIEGDGFGFVKILSFNISLIIVAALLFVMEFIYWKKRIHLFDKTQKRTPGKINVDNETAHNNEDVEKTGDISTTLIKSQDNNEVDRIGVKQKSRFCRKCGYELVTGSVFCSQCGTEIV